MTIKALLSYPTAKQLTIHTYTHASVFTYTEKNLKFHYTITRALCFRFSLLKPKFVVEDARGDPVFKLNGPFSLFHCVCCPLDLEFPVMVYFHLSK